MAAGSEETTGFRFRRTLGLSWFLWTGLALSSVWVTWALLAGSARATPLTVLGFPIGWYPVSRLFAFFFGWYVWWLATPLIVWLARRFSLRSGDLRRALPVHVLAALVLATLPSLVNLIYMTLTDLLPTGGGSRVSVRFLLFARYPLDVAMYAVICAISTALDAWRATRDQQVAAARLETELAQARMQVMSGKLHPHFLFNSLNGVAMLLRAEAYAEALPMLLGFAELLRELLDTESDLIPLERELAFVARYVALEQMRYPDRLAFTVEADAATAGALVPALLLQPLVENSLRHGFSAGESPGRLAVRATRRNGALVLEVEDNGCGLPADWVSGQSSGIGLRSIESRLQHQRSQPHRFVLRSPGGRGTIALIELPFMTVAPVEAR